MLPHHHHGNVLGIDEIQDKQVGILRLHDLFGAGRWYVA